MVATYYLYYPSSEEFSLKCKFVYTRLWSGAWYLICRLTCEFGLACEKGFEIIYEFDGGPSSHTDSLYSVYLGRIVFCVFFTQVTPVDRKNYSYVCVCWVCRIYYGKKYHHIFAPVEASATSSHSHISAST